MNRSTFAGLTVGVALVAGFGGGLASHAAFPAPRGLRGVVGVAGDRGPEGPPGSTGQPGKMIRLDLNRLGYCFNYNTQTSTDGTTTWVTGVYLNPPNEDKASGALSCPSGSFVSLTPFVTSTP